MMPAPARRFALAAIRGYQRWISPHKGFRCALRAMTGGESCSSYGHRVIQRFGLRRGLGLLDRRFELCGHLHRSLPRPRRAASVRHPWRHREQGHCDLPCDAPGCDLPDLHCQGGRACSFAGDLLEVADCCCGGGGGDCGWRSGRRKRIPRDTAHLDALARRIRENKDRGKRGS